MFPRYREGPGVEGLSVAQVGEEVRDVLKEERRGLRMAARLIQFQAEKLKSRRAEGFTLRSPRQ
jgi:hypothetical protein